MIGYIIFRFRIKPVIPFYFGIWDPLLLIIIGIVINKIIMIYMEYRFKKYGISKIQLFLLYLFNLFYKYLKIIESKIFSYFPNVFFKICKFCDYLLMMEYKISQSNNILKKIIYKILMHLSIIPIFITFFLDWYYLHWHWIFWGFVISFFFHLVFVKLLYRWGKIYANWWVSKNFSSDELKKFLQK
jgi:hypothetical protein